MFVLHSMKLLLAAVVVSIIHGQTLNNTTCDYRFLTQPIDHFANNNGTFQQRYSIFTEFFKPGGPIMFFQGEETVTLDCAVSFI
jgi:hypothetical protein